MLKFVLMKKVFPLIVCLLFILGCSKKDSLQEGPIEDLKKQKSFSGLIPESAKEYLKLEQSKMARSFAKPDEKKYANLPPTVDFSTDLPAAGVQGEQNSCTGWTTAYAVKSFQEKREHGWRLSDATLFSPSFIYNQINEGKDQGATLKSAIDFLIEKGTVPLSLMPYNEKDYSTQPSKELQALGVGFHSLGQRRLDSTDMNLVKSYLAAGEPIILVVELYENFLNSKPEDKGRYQERKGEFLGYHAIVAVGYNDEKKAIKVLNSWGTEWGDKGYGWIDYNLFPQVTKRAYLMYDTPSAPAAVNLVKKSLEMPLQVADGYLDLTIQPLLIVPNEAGIFFGDHWLRLGEAMKEQETFFSEKKSQHFSGYKLNTDNLSINADDVVVMFDPIQRDKIGKFRFTNQKRVPIYTNEGVTFGSSREDVKRIYGKPDAVDQKATTFFVGSGNDVYFFHPIKSDWGGVQLDQYAMLQFNYDHQRKVISMELAIVFKQMVTQKGGFYVDFVPGEKEDKNEGTFLSSKVGEIEILIPKIFTDLQKADWGAAGMGYFAKNGACALTTKVFYMKDNVDKAAIEKRIDADISTQKLANLSKDTVTEKNFEGGLFGGTTWTYLASKDQKRVHYYTGKGSKLYQIEAICQSMTWLEDVMNSIKLH